MRLLDLPTDILVHIANYSVDNGDAIWFSLICKSAARALTAGQTSSKLSSVFSSLSRLRFAIERLDCARSKIASVRGASVKHALARSLDRARWQLLLERGWKTGAHGVGADRADRLLLVELEALPARTR